MNEPAAHPTRAGGSRWLTPAGRAAVAVLWLTDARARPSPLTDGEGRPVDWPAPGVVRHAWLSADGSPVDELLAMGAAEGCELHVHGGEGGCRAVTRALRQAGFPIADGRGKAAADTPGCLRAARARASATAGPLAQLAAQLAVQADGQAGLPAALRRLLARALANSVLASRLRRPAVVRLVGRPNAGKSTLFNALLVEERALVSPQAGTTRDTVVATARLLGVPVQLEDTAGDSTAELERPGADLLLHLLCTPDEPQVVAPPDVPVMRVLGHGDQHEDAPAVSGLTGRGVAGLAGRLAAALGLPGGPEDDAWTPLDASLLAALRGLASGS